MAALSDYVTGTISLTNGEIEFTGSGTGWLLASFREGDTIIDITGATEFMGVIATIEANGAGTLTKAWEGPDLVNAAYRMRYQADGQRVTAQARNLIELLGNGNLQAVAGLAGSADRVIMFTGPGTMTTVPKTDLVSGVAYDVQVDALADRAAYNGQAEGFSVLVANVGDGRAAVYAKASAASGDWTDPAYVTGPIGPAPVFTVDDTTTLGPGSAATFSLTPTVDGYEIDIGIPAGRGPKPLGTYNPAAAYVLDDAVLDNGSTWVLTVSASAGNAPPTLPTTSNAFWQLLARKGTDGAGTVTSLVAGPGIKVNSTDPTQPIVSSLVAISPQGRLSLTSGVAVTTADVAGAPTVYYVPAVGNKVPVYDGAEFDPKSIGAGLSLSLDADSGHARYHAANNNYDVFVFMLAGVPRLCTGAPWSTGTNRGTGHDTTELEFFEGFWVNKNAVTVRYGASSGDAVALVARRGTYVGSLRTTANGQTDDTQVKRLVYNAYNQAPRILSRKEPTETWAYALNVWRQQNANAANRFDILAGLAGSMIEARASGRASSNQVANQAVNVGLGLDKTNDSDAQYELVGLASTTNWGFPEASYAGHVPLGFHYYAIVEKGSGTPTITWASWDKALIATGTVWL